MSEGLGYISKKIAQPALQAMFIASAKKKINGLKAMTEEYNSYKNHYAKHLHFDQEENNFSK